MVHFDAVREVLDQFCGCSFVTDHCSFLLEAISSCNHVHHICTFEKSRQFFLLNWTELNNYAVPLINSGKLCIDYFPSLELSFWTSLPSKLMWLSLFVNAHWHSTYCVDAFVILTSVILCICAAPLSCFIQTRFPTTTYLTFLLRPHHLMPLKITAVNNLLLNSYCGSKGSTCWYMCLLSLHCTIEVYAFPMMQCFKKDIGLLLLNW